MLETGAGKKGSENVQFSFAFLLKKDGKLWSRVYYYRLDAVTVDNCYLVSKMGRNIEFVFDSVIIYVSITNVDYR